MSFNPVAPTPLQPATAAQSNAIHSLGTFGSYFLPISTFASTLVNGEYFDGIKLAFFALIQKVELVALKNIFQKLRPDGIRFDSFPSAHTSFAFMAVGYCIPKASLPVTIAVTTGASLVALSRYVTQTHWAADILVGAALGMLNGFLAAMKYSRAEAAIIPPAQNALRRAQEQIEQTIHPVPPVVPPAPPLSFTAPTLSERRISSSSVES